MCRTCATNETGLTRRGLLRNTAVLGVPAIAGLLAPATRADPTDAIRAAGRPPIHARSAWAGRAHPVQGALAYEAAGDVRCLLVHHSETTNAYQQSAVPQIIGSFYRTHTDKGWPDIAYNFLVDRYGGIWEGRANSLRSATIPSATGGSQGFSQIVCWIGNHRRTQPTTAARRSMVSLTSWLCDRYDIDAAPGATVSFRSRGSTRWRRGALVTTPAIEGHRFMSLTDCPGDAAYPVVRGLPMAIDAHRRR